MANAAGHPGHRLQDEREDHPARLEWKREGQYQGSIMMNDTGNGGNFGDGKPARVSPYENQIKERQQGIRSYALHCLHQRDFTDLI
jgi:hypothetical protein